MNKLEEFIESNRDEMDDATPSAGVWQNVEANLNSKKKKVFLLSPILKWSVAAAVIVMVGVNAYLILKKDKITESSVVDTQTEMPPEVGPFAKMIALKQEELKTLSKDQPELYQKFSNDITQLDSSYKALKNEYNTSPNQEVLIEAMIQNLQLQLNVLNQQLNIIHQIKQPKNYSHEKIDQRI